MSNMYTKCITFYVLKNHFKKMCGFVNLFLKLYIYIYVLSSRFEEFRYQEMIYHHFFKNLSNIEKKNCLCAWRYCCENR